MIELPKNINLILFIAAFILSAQFTYYSWEAFSANGENHFSHILLAISIIGLALIFYYNYIQILKNSKKSAKLVYISKTLSALLFIYAVCCFSIFHYMLINQGFATGKVLYEQIFGLVLGLFLIALIYRYIKQKKIIIDYLTPKKHDNKSNMDK